MERSELKFYYPHLVHESQGCTCQMMSQDARRCPMHGFGKPFDVFTSKENDDG